MSPAERKKNWRTKPENQVKERLRTRERYRNDPKVKVRRVVQNAKRRGLIKDRPCVICGSKEQIEHHHENYSKPFEFIYLCAPCHRKLHKERREETKRAR